MRLSATEVEHLQTRVHPATTDLSTIARLLQPWWNACMAVVPARLAPNVLTVLGSLAVLVPTAVAAWFAPTLTEPLPAWLLLVQIAGIFTFQTLDALDGKQARKTGSSSPLGSWLDHTLDIATCQLMFLGTLITLGVGIGAAAWLMLGVAVVNNYMLHWESSHTRMLVLGNGTSITDAQVSCIAIHAIGIIAPTVFPSTVAALVPAIAGTAGADLTMGALVVLVSTVSVGGIGAVSSVIRVARSDVGAFESLRRLVSVLVIMVPGTAALFLIDDVRSRVVVGVASLIVGVRSVGRIVLENLLQRTPVTLDVPGVVVAVLVQGAVVQPQLALAIGGAAFVVAAVSFSWFLIDTARSLAAALGESIFTLKPATATVSSTT